MSQDSASPSPFPGGRSCEGCTLCCTIMGVKALDKPRNTACTFCAEGVGCSAYDRRPRECATFFCAWLYVPDLGPEWRPADCGLVLHYDHDARRMEVHVDPARPDAWLGGAHYAQLQAWAAASAPAHGQVIVWIGEDQVAILPQGHKALGPVRPDQFLVNYESVTDDGEPIYDILVMDKDDPRLAPRD